MMCVCVAYNLCSGIHSAWFAWVGQSRGRWVCSGEAGQLFRRIDTQRRRMYAKQLNCTPILTNTSLLYTVACPWLANLAPELLDPDTDMWTTAIDVYAFGVILWELFTWVAFLHTYNDVCVAKQRFYLFICVCSGRRAHAGMAAQAIVDGVLNNELRPSIPSDLPHVFARLMKWIFFLSWK